MADEEVEEIIALLTEASERLTDRGIDLLRGAVREGAGASPDGEKTLARARRSVDKAIGLLSALGSPGVEGLDE